MRASPCEISLYVVCVPIRVCVFHRTGRSAHTVVYLSHGCYTYTIRHRNPFCTIRQMYCSTTMKSVVHMLLSERSVNILVASGSQPLYTSP